MNVVAAGLPSTVVGTIATETSSSSKPRETKAIGPLPRHPDAVLDPQTGADLGEPLLDLLRGVRAGRAEPLVHAPADEAVAAPQEAQGAGRRGQRGQQVGGRVDLFGDRRHRQSGRRHGSHERQE